MGKKQDMYKLLWIRNEKGLGEVEILLAKKWVARFLAGALLRSVY